MKSPKALKILSALAQETRLEIIRLLIQENETGLSAGTIAEIMQVPSATLSFHLSQLTNAGLLTSRKEGRLVFYAIRHKTIKSLYKHLTENSFKKRQKNTLLIKEDPMIASDSTPISDNNNKGDTPRDADEA